MTTSFFNHKDIINQKMDGFGHDYLYIKREDQIHPFVSGNKFRKLKYNVLEFKSQGLKGILTFGGAFSNHIAAVAALGNELDFPTLGIIRGEELENQINDNPTLKFASENGMTLKFVSREIYKLRNEIDYISTLKNKFPEYLILPEGGTNELAVKGCEEILTAKDNEFDYIACCVGTGGTISGIINSALPHQKVLGFPALKEDFLQKDISKFAHQKNWELIRDYHFGGYGKVTNELVRFINHFFEQTQIPLDPIYTGKMVFGILDLIQKRFFKPNDKILLIHSGGLQGIEGFNRLKKQVLEKINIHV
jgi:1-aminocyclopropane-1-carboxylate deaminase